MPNFVWGRDPQEAFEEPYEYEAQDQFRREAKKLLVSIYKCLNCDRHRYTREDRSLAKALWLLEMDVLDSLLDSLDALSTKRHRVASKLFRITFEASDIAIFLKIADKEKQTDLLNRWYSNDIISHGEFRNYLEAHGDSDLSKRAKRDHQVYSKFVHRSYYAICDGYMRGAEDRLAHDRSALLFSESLSAETDFAIPQTIAAYHASLSHLILRFLDDVRSVGCLNDNEVEAALQESLESEEVKRRFMTREGFIAKFCDERSA